MTIDAEWTDLDTLELIPTDYLTAANWNAVLGNQAFLASAPQVALRLTTAQEVAHDSDHTIEWDTATWTGAGDTMWDADAESKGVITRDGTYDLSCHVLPNQTIPVDDMTLTLYVNSAVRIGPVKGAQMNIQTTNLETGDELEVVFKHQYGEAVNLQDTQTRFTIRWVGFPPTGAP